jgi:hypothetical protein
MNAIKCFDILLPKVLSLNKWAVVSCDQFTSQRKYWAELSEFVGQEPSTLKMIFPEVYLEDGDAAERIEAINRTMREYLKQGVFTSLKDSAVLVRRTTLYGAERLGLMVSVDLEEYSFTHPSDAVVRSTEGVVENRIPPRLRIRENAPLEIPHIMLLIDDDAKSVIEPFYENRGKYELLYDFELNMNGGHLSGWRLDFKAVSAAFDGYCAKLCGKYGCDTRFVFAVGDGNHSLATAQAHWNKIKASLSGEERENHPARFALCEVENLHSDGIGFQPIHRFVFGAEESELVSFLSDRLKGEGSVTVFSKGVEFYLHAPANGAEAIAEIQKALDEFVGANPETKIDYIHGREHLEQLASEFDGVAVEMPTIQKKELFSYVLKNGNLSRKAFSMGEAEEKRYYMEAKAIK